MTRSQRDELNRLSHLYSTTGLGKAELSKKEALERIDASEVHALADQLAKKFVKKTNLTPRLNPSI